MPALVLLGFIFLVFFLIFQYIRLDFVLPLISYFAVRKGLTKEQKLILEKKFGYYKNLKPAEKKEFERRLKYFIYHKEFIAKDLPNVTEEMKVLVGAAAVQLTFGYAPLKFPHFPKIVLFPGRFYSKGSDKLKKGEVNGSGLIVLSWTDFIRDYKIPNDGINLGLHEMAHALRVEDATEDGEYAFINENELKEFYEVSREEFHKLRRGEKSFIRPYAGTDMEEFFAVAVEQFFEQPEQFEAELPEIYYPLSRLLNQDPAKALKKR